MDTLSLLYWTANTPAISSRERQSLFSKAIKAFLPNIITYKANNSNLFSFKILIFFHHGFFAVIFIFKNTALKIYFDE